MGAISDIDPKSIEAKANVILSADHFSALGVTKTSSPDDVQRAFLELVKTWHPDRVPAGQESMRPLFARVFGRLNVAKTTLIDPQRRLRYIEDLTKHDGRSGGGDGKGAEAALELKKAEVLLKKNDLVQAEALLRRAVDLAPGNADARATLIAILAKPTSPPDELKGFVAELDAAIARDPHCAKAYSVRGQLRKRLGLLSQSNQDFEKVVELEPNNIDAQREVRLFAMRKERAAPGSKDAKEKASAEPGEGVGGFFKKLFKR